MNFLLQLFQKRLILLFAFISIVLAISGCAQRSETSEEQVKAATAKPIQENELAATYKGGKVTKQELEKFIVTLSFMNPQQVESQNTAEFKEYVLKQLVMTRILNARASEQVKAAAEIKVKQQMDPVDKIAAQQKAELETNLKTAKLTYGDIEQYFRMTFTAVEEMSSKVTDQQIKASYDNKLKQDSNAFTFGTVDHILIGTKDLSDITHQKEIRTKEEALKRAKEVQSKLIHGSDFAALAKEYSDDPGSKDQGGKFENIDFNQFEPKFRKTANGLKLNTISPPVETDYGYHIIKVDSRSNRALAEMRDSIRNELANVSMNDFMAKDFLTYDYKSIR